MPEVWPHAGTVLSATRLVTITFDDYARRARVEQFGDAVVGSSWFATVGAEYGVRSGSHVQKVHAGAAPASLGRADIEQLIKQLITDGTAMSDPATANQLLYMLYVPAHVARGPGLERLLGYHDSVKMPGNIEYAFAVVLDNAVEGPPESAPTLEAARLLINAATNPYDTGYYADPSRSDPWFLVRGEVADLCEGETPVMDRAFALPRVYSSAAASAGKPPCKPAMAGDTWNEVSAEPATIQPIRRGGSVTFLLTGWSTEEVPDWKLRTRAADFSQFTEPEMRPELSDDMINNGTTVMLTLRAPIDAPLGATGGVSILSGANLHPWAVGFIVAR